MPAVKATLSGVAGRFFLLTQACIISLSFSDIIVATTEVCPGSNQILGVKATTGIGASLGIKAFRESDESDPFVTVTLAVSSYMHMLFGLLIFTL